MKRIFAFLTAFILLFSCFASAEQRNVSFRTEISGIDPGKRANIALAAERIDNTAVAYGDSFSFNGTIGARTLSNGYQTAPNGRGVSVTGGGVAQAATTLYLALEQLNGISYSSLSFYGAAFRDSYVSGGDSAVLVDSAAGIDFAFTNYGDDLLIEMWLSDEYLYCMLTVGTSVQATSSPYANWSLPNAGSGRVLSRSEITLSGSDSLIRNIALAAGSVNDTVLLPGDVFSFNDTVGPRTAEAGYENAVNGRGVRVTGGGVAQVASALWLAVRDLDCVSIVSKSTYGNRYTGHYVSGSNDAILTDYKSGTDFSFRNCGNVTLTLRTVISGSALVCEIVQG